ncbi:hypothetical protein BN12_4060023 [Nostocoides japonicum T1-X7]|uniref:Uncharacterized protein n=1 Tax=Nostocoides japonicum T1-X7 TaxID=1194083 RepID=A0A077LZ90_9MICO|nr:hypothetical protein BN12_4060023 [Tetrasphaera japonica T1-X7]
MLAEPERSGSTRTSRRCQGGVPPPRPRFQRHDGCQHPRWSGGVRPWEATHPLRRRSLEFGSVPQACELRKRGDARAKTAAEADLMLIDVPRWHEWGLSSGRWSLTLTHPSHRSTTTLTQGRIPSS